MNFYRFRASCYRPSIVLPALYNVTQPLPIDFTLETAIIQTHLPVSRLNPRMVSKLFQCQLQRGYLVLPSTIRFMYAVDESYATRHGFAIY